MCVVNMFIVHAPRGVFCDTRDEHAALGEHYAICRSCTAAPWDRDMIYGLRHARDVSARPASSD